MDNQNAVVEKETEVMEAHRFRGGRKGSAKVRGLPKNIKVKVNKFAKRLGTKVCTMSSNYTIQSFRTRKPMMKTTMMTTHLKSNHGCFIFCLCSC